jgi:hypothetical protein
LLTGKHSHVLNLVMQRFTYLRQFAPALLHSLAFRVEEGGRSSVVEAVELLQEMNRENRRKLPEDAPLDFIPKPLRTFVEKKGVVDKHAWECVLLTALRDEIRAGNIFVEESKRFGRSIRARIISTGPTESLAEYSRQNSSCSLCRIQRQDNG